MDPDGDGDFGDGRRESRERLPVGILEGIAGGLDLIMSSIADLTGNVTALTSAVDALEAKQGTDQGTHLDAADQAAIDAAVTGLADVTAKLEAIVNPPAPAPSPTPTGTTPTAAETPGAVDNGNGTWTYPDGTVHHADGSAAA